jgi:hypothetical protein
MIVEEIDVLVIEIKWGFRHIYVGVYLSLRLALSNYVVAFSLYTEEMIFFVGIPRPSEIEHGPSKCPPLSTSNNTTQMH